MFQARCGKVDEFGWWYLDWIQPDSDMQFTSKDLQEGLSVRGVQLILEAPYHI